MYKSVKVSVSLWKTIKQLALDEDTTIARIIEEAIRCKQENIKK